MKKFTQFLNAQGLREWLDDRGTFEVPLVEAKLSRVFQYVEDDSKQFGIVSAFRTVNSEQENRARHEELKKAVRSMGYGFIEMRGGYKGDEGYAEELSLLIPKIKKKEIVDLGRQYEQHSVMFKDKQDFYYIGTNQESGVGKVLMRFKKGAGQENLELAKHKVADFFSSLKKGPHRKTKFVFNPAADTAGGGGGGGGGESAASAERHKPGQIWKTSSGIWGAMDKEGNYEYFEDQEKAQKYAKAHRRGMRIQEREEWNFAKATYLRRGDEPKWITIYEDLPPENT